MRAIAILAAALTLTGCATEPVADDYCGFTLSRGALLGEQCSVVVRGDCPPAARADLTLGECSATLNQE